MGLFYNAPEPTQRPPPYLLRRPCAKCHMTLSDVIHIKQIKLTTEQNRIVQLKKASVL